MIKRFLSRTGTPLALFVSVFMLNSCMDAPRTPSPLSRASWLSGRWESSDPNGVLSEQWEQVNDSLWSGRSYFVSNMGDTLFRESIRLKALKGLVFYEVTLPDQNHGAPVAFQLRPGGGDTLVFENPNHDFPDKIVYFPTETGRMVALISGMENGKPEVRKIEMARVSSEK